MLRVGLTGGLGSGKSTVAAHLRTLGAHVIEADELGRALMQPGQPVYDAIVRQFGPGVVRPDGLLDRAELARLAFADHRLDELNAIVHPAVIQAQQQWAQSIFAADPTAITVVESALIFEVERDARLRGETEGVLASWRRRFDCVLLVTAPESLRLQRYVARMTGGAWSEQIAADARARMQRQMNDTEKMALADFVLVNDGSREQLLVHTQAIWNELQRRSRGNPPADAFPGSDSRPPEHGPPIADGETG